MKPSLYTARSNISTFLNSNKLYLCISNYITVIVYIYTGLFISPSGTSELDCATTKTDTAERSISIGGESLKVFFIFVLGALAYLQVPPLGGSRDVWFETDVEKTALWCTFCAAVRGRTRCTSTTIFNQRNCTRLS